MLRKVKKPFWIIAIIFYLSTFLSCYTQKGDPRYFRDGKQYGITEGTFRNRWWNYYERGNSFLEGEFSKEAIEDYKEAIKQRDKDQRRARTYGLHFIDYFPHRELGIAYLNTGTLEDAIRELEKSLSSVETAKAKYFLNKARQKFLLEKGIDKKPPSITSIPPKKGSITNDFSVELVGSVEDDFYVAGITINGKPLRIELAEKKISFKQEIPLERGENQITIKAFDLTGKSSEESFNIRTDREGPLVNIESFEIIEAQERLKAKILAYAYDESNISSFLINGKECLKSEEKEIEISSEVSISSRDEKLIFEAKDIVGNKTSGTLSKEFFERMTHYPQYAYNENNPPFSPFNKGGCRGIFRWGKAPSGC